jgi:hypothetical protein
MKEKTSWVKKMNQSESRILIVRRWKIEDEVGTIVAGGI